MFEDIDPVYIFYAALVAAWQLLHQLGPWPGYILPGPRQVAEALWHGFADMHVIADREIVMVSGDGSVITDSAGRAPTTRNRALGTCLRMRGRISLMNHTTASTLGR